MKYSLHTYNISTMIEVDSSSSNTLIREIGNSVDRKIPEANGVPHLPAANGWNDTIVKAKDPYVLMRDCNANSRFVPLRQRQGIITNIITGSRRSIISGESYSGFWFIPILILGLLI